MSLADLGGDGYRCPGCERLMPGWGWCEDCLIAEKNDRRDSTDDPR